MSAQFKEFWSRIANIAKLYFTSISGVDIEDFLAEFHFDGITESRGVHCCCKNGNPNFWVMLDYFPRTSVLNAGGQ